jgi:hypothetical protein
VDNALRCGKTGFRVRSMYEVKTREKGTCAEGRMPEGI